MRGRPSGRGAKKGSSERRSREVIQGEQDKHFDKVEEEATPGSRFRGASAAEGLNPTAPADSPAQRHLDLLALSRPRKIPLPTPAHFSH
jgi:hypothetical protein